MDEAALKLHPDDDVAVARRPLAPGTRVADGLAALAEIPQGHKVALRAVANGAPVRKYGQVIGFAAGAIAPGEHVHVHNLKVKEFARAGDVALGVPGFDPV